MLEIENRIALLLNQADTLEMAGEIDLAAKWENRAYELARKLAKLRGQWK